MSGLQTFTLWDFFSGCHEKRKYYRLSHHQPPTGTCIWVSTAMVVPFHPCAISSSCYLTVYIISLISYQWDEEFLSQHPPITSLMKPSRRHNKRDPTPLTIFKALPLANVSSCRPHHSLTEKTPAMKPRQCWQFHQLNCPHEEIGGGKIPPMKQFSIQCFVPSPSSPHRQNVLTNTTRRPSL